MLAADCEDFPTARSWLTPKAVKGGASAIDGRGVHAVEAIVGGEVVAVKGGHVMPGRAVAGLPEAIRDSAFPIAQDLFLAALACDEYDGVMMRVNHSCEPNLGMGGNVLLVSMRDIAAGEESLTTCDIASQPPGPPERAPLRGNKRCGTGSTVGRCGITAVQTETLAPSCGQALWKVGRSGIRWA